MSNVYTIRVDEERGANRHDVNDWLCRMGGAYLLAFEVNSEGVNPHVQGWFYTDVKIDSARQNFRRKFPDLKGNASFSIIQCREPDNYKRYVLKGERDKFPDIVGFHGIGPEYTLEGQRALHAMYWQLKDETAKEIASKRKERLKSFREKIWSECQELKDKSYRNVVRIIVEAYAEAGKSCDIYSIRRMANGIMLNLDSRFKNAFIEQVVQEGINCLNAYEERKEIYKDKIEYYKEDIEI